MTLQKKGQNRDSCDSDSRSRHNPKSNSGVEDSLIVRKVKYRETTRKVKFR